MQTEYAQAVDRLVGRAAEAAARRSYAEAESLLDQGLRLSPNEPRLLALRGQICLDTGRLRDAAQWFASAAATDPGNSAHDLDHAFALLADERLSDAAGVLARAVDRHSDCHPAWLMLGQIREACGDDRGALKAYHQAVTQAQRSGVWRDEASTPANMRSAVVHAIGTLRERRRELYFASYDDIRTSYGGRAVAKVDRALSAYLKEIDAAPPSPHQRPRFFYFPDLPAGPFHDPYLHSWAPALREAFPAIRDEALHKLAEGTELESFIRFRDTVPIEHYLRSQRGRPAWDAFFFYRHGQRYDAHHVQCPRTSAALESIDLCRIVDEAPEICFSVLTAGSEILPHHGVTNARLVMHLPLLVPTDCALNVFGGGQHHWQEGELMMFDDTYLHEAWNRSDGTRVVLLMDCWNPHLDPAEREATRRLIETISGLSRPSGRRN